MGYLTEAQIRATLPYLDDEDSLETGEVGWYGNLYQTAAQQIVLDEVEVRREHRISTEKRARYAEDLRVEFAYWQREFDRDRLGSGHSWFRQECHAKHESIAKGDTLVVAEYPFGGRQRYKQATFRSALTSARKPFFTNAFDSKLAAARAQGRTDLATFALELLEDPSVLERDPFNTGTKRVAGISLPPAPFHEALGDHGRRIGLDEDARNGLALGTCRNPRQVHDAIQRDLYELITKRAEVQARMDKQQPDGLLRFVKPPPGSKRSKPLRLTDDVPYLVDDLVPHAVWQAMAGPGPTETIPEDRLVAGVAFRRLDDLLYNLQRRVNRMNAKYRSSQEISTG